MKELSYFTLNRIRGTLTCVQFYRFFKISYSVPKNSKEGITALATGSSYIYLSILSFPTPYKAYFM